MLRSGPHDLTSAGSRMRDEAPYEAWYDGHDVSAQEIDVYLARVEEPKRATLQQLRETIRSIVPEAEEGISYGCPAFRLNGKVIAGFAAFTNHLSYLPHSGSVLGRLRADLVGYGGTKSALHFPIDRPLPRALVSKLLQAKLQELQARR